MSQPAISSHLPGNDENNNFQSEHPRDQSRDGQDVVFYTSALRREKHEIRLLTIQPGEKHEVIKISLSVISLDDQPKYEALSYVWGDPHITKNILLDGQEFPVTTNLHAALIRLRGTHEARIFWIDAICVNQKDLKERGSQVSLMARIYTECMLCTVWLGEETQTTEKAFELLEFFACGKHFHELPYFVSDDNTGKSDPTNQPKSLEYPHVGMFEPLHVLFNGPWWTRTWTVQEIVLPKLAVVRCGQYETAWGTILRGYRSAFAHMTECCGHVPANLSHQDEDAVAEFLAAMSTLVESWETHRNSNTPPEMILVLASKRVLNTSDLRDKVYGFLSLCPPTVQETCHADYSAGLVECYSWPVMHDFQHSNTLRALSLAELYDNEILLPSWIPDWSQFSDHAEHQSLLLDYYSMYSAAGDIGVFFSTKGNLLSLKGTHQETIIHTGQAIGWLQDTPLETMKTWHDLWQQICGQSTSKIARDKRKHMPSAPFIRTLLRGVYDPGRTFEEHAKLPRTYHVPSEADYEACERWWELSQYNNTYKPHLCIDDKVEVGRMRSVYNALLETLVFSRFFITDKHSIGLGPQATKVGDEVWIVCGGKQPLILRRQENGTSDGVVENSRHEVYHKLVSGACYVDGIMAGEAAGNLERDAVDVHLV